MVLSSLAGEPGHRVNAPHVVRSEHNHERELSLVYLVLKFFLTSGDMLPYVGPIRQCFDSQIYQSSICHKVEFLSLLCMEALQLHDKPHTSVNSLSNMVLLGGASQPTMTGCTGP